MLPVGGAGVTSTKGVREECTPAARLGWRSGVASALSLTGAVSITRAFWLAVAGAPPVPSRVIEAAVAIPRPLVYAVAYVELLQLPWSCCTRPRGARRL